MEVENRTLEDECGDLLHIMSVQDMRDLAFEMYQRGEDIASLVELIHQKDMQSRIAKEM